MKKCLIKMIALILIVSLFSELSIKTEKDNFFWQREDNIYFVHNFIEHVFTRQPDQSSSGSIKTVSLEADNSAVFRNRRRKILSFSSDFWNNIHIVPVPSIPYPLNHNWIFANGPVFPRNDRVFKLLGKSSISKDIVLYDKPESITLGIRSGSLPVSMDIELGAVHKKITLYPNEDDLTVIIPAKWREIKSKKQLGYNIFILPLNIKSLLGNAWISVLKDKREVAYFKLFSGSINKISEYNLQKYLFITPEEKIVKEMKHTRFIEGYKETKIVSDVYYKDFSAILLSKESIPLPCGVYIFEGDIIGLSNTSKISFQIGEAKGYFNALSQSKKIISIDRGEQKIKFSFSKTFAPYECNILISPIIGKCRLKKWKITPDTVQVLSDLKKWKIHGDKPLWLKKYPYAQKEDLSTIQENILFDNKIELKYFYFPSSLKNGAKYDVYCGMDLKDFNMRRFDEYYVFLHFMDKNHKQIYAGQLPLWQAVEAYRSRIPITCKPVNGLPKGEYEIKMGIWHARTDKRLPVSCNRITKKERRRRRIFVSKTTVLE